MKMVKITAVYIINDVNNNNNDDADDDDQIIHSSTIWVLEITITVVMRIAIPVVCK